MAVISLDELKARAEAMRRAGASMAEISRAVGRSPSTLYLWAAQGGWRIVDLEVEGLAPNPNTSSSGLTGGSRDHPIKSDDDEGLGGTTGAEDFAGLAPQKDDRPPAAWRACPETALSAFHVSGPTGRAAETTKESRSDDPDGSEHPERFAPLGPPDHSPRKQGETSPTAEPLSPLDAAKALHQRSAELGQAGQIRAAEAAARLAERIIRTEAQLLRIDIANPEPDPDGQEEWPGGARAELARRFQRIRELHAEQLARDPDWTPEASGAASEADKFVFSLFR